MILPSKRISCACAVSSGETSAEETWDLRRAPSDGELGSNVVVRLSWGQKQERVEFELGG